MFLSEAVIFVLCMLHSHWFEFHEILVSILHIDMPLKILLSTSVSNSTRIVIRLSLRIKVIGTN